MSTPKQGAVIGYYSNYSKFQRDRVQLAVSIIDRENESLLY